MTKLEKKYNAINNFMAKAKNVVFEDGCLNFPILSVEYDRQNDIIAFRVQGMNEVYLIEVQAEEIEYKQIKLRIDRKYKAIEYIRCRAY